MADVTDDDVQASRDRVAALRQELSDTTNELAISEASRNNVVRKAQLDQEADRLERELEAARARLEVSREEEPTQVLQGTATAVTTEGDYPKATGSGWYELSDGNKVQGEEEANRQQALLYGQTEEQPQVIADLPKDVANDPLKIAEHVASSVEDGQSTESTDEASGTRSRNR